MSPKNLVIGLNWMGDVLMSFPALARMAANKKVDVITRPHLTDLYKLHPGVGRVWAIETKRHLWTIFRELSKVRKMKYDRVLVFPKSMRSAIVAFIIGGKKRIGFQGEMRNWFLHKSVLMPAEFERIHESDLYSLLVSNAGFQAIKGWVPPNKIPQNARESLNQKFDNSREFIVLAPGAAFGETKRWPAKQFAEFGKRFASEVNIPLVITGSAGEAVITKQVSNDLGPLGRDLGGKTSILELALLLSQSRLLITNDSGTMHLGALFNVPMIVLVGSTDMKRTAPLTDKAVFIRGKSCEEPCRKPVCKLGDNRCMTSIQVEEVFSTALRMLNTSLQPNGN